MLNNLKQNLKNDLIAGLLVVIPLATTIWLTITIARWVINFLTLLPKQLNPFDDLHPILVSLFNLLVGLAVPLLSILLIGLMARNIVGRWLLDLGERILQGIPLAGSVYKTLKQLLETLLQDSKNKFRGVVLVEYPRKGMWAIAFVTGTMSGLSALGSATSAPRGHSELKCHLSEKMLSIFVPTTPNPTTGWYAIVPEDETIELSISIEDAFKVLISGGLVSPDSSVPLPELAAKDRQMEPALGEKQPLGLLQVEEQEL